MQAPFEVVEALRHVGQTYDLKTLPRRDVIALVSEGTHEGAWLNQVPVEDWDDVVALALVEVPSVEEPVAKRGKRGVQVVEPVAPVEAPVDLTTEIAPPTEPTVEETPVEPKVDTTKK